MIHMRSPFSLVILSTSHHTLPIVMLSVAEGEVETSKKDPSTTLRSAQDDGCGGVHSAQDDGCGGVLSRWRTVKAFSSKGKAENVGNACMHSKAERINPFPTTPNHRLRWSLPVYLVGANHDSPAGHS